MHHIFGGYESSRWKISPCLKKTGEKLENDECVKASKSSTHNRWIYPRSPEFSSTVPHLQSGSGKAGRGEVGRGWEEGWLSLSRARGSFNYFPVRIIRHASPGVLRKYQGVRAMNRIPVLVFSAIYIHTYICSTSRRLTIREGARMRIYARFHAAPNLSSSRKLEKASLPFSPFPSSALALTLPVLS